MSLKRSIRQLLLGILLIAPFPTYSYEAALAFRTACFIPQSSIVRKIYDDTLLDLQIEGTYYLPKRFSLWTNISYLEKKGRSIGLRDKTTMRQLPITFGVKKSFHCNYGISPYLGAGLGVTFLQFHDESPFVLQHVKLKGLAVLVKSGMEVCLTSCLYADVFLDYQWNFFNGFHSKKNIRTYNEQTGGLKIGLGLGYRF